MARIRTIKPEFWRHEELSELPEATHMLAAALLNYADDDGYFNANPKLVRAECCPLREPSVSVHDSLSQLAGIGFIRLGVADDGKRYGWIVKFSEHQRINRPSPSKIKDIPISWEGSPPTHAQITEDSPPEGKGREQEGKGEGGARAQDENSFSKRATTIPPHWKPKGLVPNAAELDRFVAHHTAKGTECVDWEAKWVVWRSRIADFGEAKTPSPAEAPAIGMTWVGEDDPRWPIAAAKHIAVKGTPLIPRTSRHAASPSHGAFVPSDWIEKAAV